MDLGSNSAYNLIADSFKLSPFSIYVRSTLFDKFNITASTILDPYQLDDFGKRKDVYMWSGGKFSLSRITNGSLAISTSFRSSKQKMRRSRRKRRAV